ncbi:hypothetical protein Y032_0053g2432 [Ancylostoma ceylanicum]|uniref:Uncharacterized protein n=1 Tax=Ancylostoma ceylanicum TaxID=53326 RepID=A0A016U790_9BILA|nr:hypothetical protein Y032_0053g2432 [Ancylostoma ceylanicum]
MYPEAYHPTTKRLRFGGFRWRQKFKSGESIHHRDYLRALFNVSDSEQSTITHEHRAQYTSTAKQLQSSQKILATGIHRPSAKPRRVSYALSYVLRRGSVDTQCSGRQVFF